MSCNFTVIVFINLQKLLYNLNKQCRPLSDRALCGVCNGPALIVNALYMGRYVLLRVYLLDLFCSGIQFNLLLSTYLRFISFLYLNLYVLGDDALIS